MRCLVKARVRTDCEKALLRAIEQETLGRGSVAEGEYLRNMREARSSGNDLVRWVEVCYCPAPLEEERPYWEDYFDIVNVQDAHDRRRCRDQNNSEPWACGHCDCTARLEMRLQASGVSFLDRLRSAVDCREGRKTDDPCRTEPGHSLPAAEHDGFVARGLA